MKTWSYVDGAPHVTRARQTVEGFGMKLGGAELTLGTGEIADQLRSLGDSHEKANDILISQGNRASILDLFAKQGHNRTR